MAPGDSLEEKPRKCKANCAAMDLCKEEAGRELCCNNHKIVAFLMALKEQRDEIDTLIKKQEEESQKLTLELERINYKLSLIAKSLSQRLIARKQYDQTILELEKSYRQLVLSSGLLLKSVEKNADSLEQSMDKRVGTEIAKENGKVACPPNCSGMPRRVCPAEGPDRNTTVSDVDKEPTRDKPKAQMMEGDQESDEASKDEDQDQDQDQDQDGSDYQ